MDCPSIFPSICSEFSEIILMFFTTVPILALIFGLSFISNAQTAPTPATDGPKAEIVFEQTMHNFGDIHQGDVVTHVFKFKNTGKAPLIISNVLVTCGCTVPVWPKNQLCQAKKEKSLQHSIVQVKWELKTK